MKNLNQMFIPTVLMAAAILTGCAKPGSPTATPAASQETPPVVDVPNGPYVPPTTGPGQNPGVNFQFGGTTDFAFDGRSVYQEYTQRTIPSMTLLSDIKVNLNLYKFSGDVYGGTVTIRYSYNGQVYEGFFTSGHTAETNKYNKWFVKDGKKVFHGFFEDFMGAIIVVIDGVTDLGDGLGSEDKVSGKIFFKNFPNVLGAHPPSYCWFVSIGPYDCRAWKDGKKVNTTMAIEPLSTDGYTRLGTFQDLDVNKSFNDELSL